MHKNYNFCKLQKKYARKGTAVALSYYLPAKKYIAEKIVLVENQKINCRSSDLGYKKISLNPRGEQSFYSGKIPRKTSAIAIRKGNRKKGAIKRGYKWD